MSPTPRISDLMLQKWAESGSKQVRTLLEKAVHKFDANEDSISDTDSDYYQMSHELLTSVIRGQITAQDVVKVLKDIDFSKHQKVCQVFLDIIWVISNEIELNERGRDRYSSREWQYLSGFVKALSEHEIVPALDLKSSLENDLLFHAGLIKDQQSQHKKMLRINTKTFYTQMKYNLLREESEGFAKVLCILYANVNLENLDAIKTDIFALIGYFNLDANRILDLILDAFEKQPSNNAYSELLRGYKRQSILHIIGFKFQYYKREATEENITPRSLYTLAATLIREKLIDGNELIVHLSPSKDDIVSYFLSEMKKIEQTAKNFGKVNLSSKSQAVKTPDESNSVDEVMRKRAHECDHHNQLYGLLASMLEIGLVPEAFEIIQWFRDRGIKPLMCKPLREGICKLLHRVLGTSYHPLSSLHLGLVLQNESIEQCSDLKDFLSEAVPILKILGEQLYCDKFLFNKVIRIVRVYLEQVVSTMQESETTNDDLEALKNLMIESIFPSLSLETCDPSIAFQIWDVIKMLPFHARYKMYQQWDTTYSSTPEMQLVRAKCVQETRRTMRRLTADQAKQSSRSVTHIAHSNPIIVFRTILRQVQSYDNLIQPAIEAFKFVTPLGMDVISFVLVSELSKSRQSMKADGTNVSLWLASLASFSGSFYRKYPNVELAGLLQYLIQRLQNWESVDLIVLGELLAKMGSCGNNEDISQNQLEAQAGGPNLWNEPPDAKHMNRRAVPRLRDALVKRDLALPLCILICQMRGRIELLEDGTSGHLKLLGRLYDTCQLTLNQLLQFLNSTVEPASYQKILPSISTLVQEYNVSPELAMTMCRPAIRFDDPVLFQTPRSIHLASNPSTNGDDDTSKRSWFMHSPTLLQDVDQAFSGGEAFTGLTVDLYTLFWSLTLYDLHIPFPQYEAEINRLRTSISSLSSQNNSSNGSIPMTSTERKKLKEKASQMIDRLTNEQKDQVTHRKRVLERLEECKMRLFSSDNQNQEAVSQLVQRCIVPRALLSPEDAFYCAKFMERLHSIDTPQFLSLQYYNLVNLKLPSIVFCITEREAGNFGIFLKETFVVLNRWFQSKGAYEEPVNGRIGLGVDLLDTNACLSHRQYRQIYARWHRSKEQAFGKALSSKEYMQIRNTLILLTKMIDVFPISRGTADNILAITDDLTSEDREDIKIMAKRYHALLSKRRTLLMEYQSLALAPIQKKTEPTTPPKGSSINSDSEGNGAVSEPVDEKQAPTSNRSNLESGEIRHENSDSRPTRSQRKPLLASRSSIDTDQSSDRDRDRRRSSSRQEAADSATSDIRGDTWKRGRSQEHYHPSRSPPKTSLPEKEQRELPKPRRDDSLDASKHQRTDMTEAELRRQLTERKQLEQKKDPKEILSDANTMDANNSKTKELNTGKKIISLVSGGKREREYSSVRSVRSDGNNSIQNTGFRDSNEASKRKRESVLPRPSTHSPMRQDSLDRSGRSLDDKKKRFHTKPQSNGSNSMSHRDDGRSLYDNRNGSDAYRGFGNRKLDRSTRNRESALRESFFVSICRLTPLSLHISRICEMKRV
uniref:THO complex subunit 2 n=1 Tax=Albugo laibachii Nc14 TaxID=890382 RepID=F0W3S1_9STRA|nr:conserved hypothetical protein [Albugo laibachii Nc14]|eukprot:CCA15741.1 conserved hypothetical protein [Albugo laibachii Nc14]